MSRYSRTIAGVDVTKSLHDSWHCTHQLPTQDIYETDNVEEFVPSERFDTDSIDPTQAITPLTASSLKELSIDWLIKNERKLDNVSENDYIEYMQDCIDGKTQYLLNSENLFKVERKVERKKSRRKTGILTFTDELIQSVKQSCIDNFMEFGFKYFYTKFPLIRELQLFMVLFLYYLLLQPRVFYHILPLIVKMAAFLLMFTYSMRIFLGNRDIFLCLKYIIPKMTESLITDKRDSQVKLKNHYFRQKHMLPLLAFICSSLVFFLFSPPIETNYTIIFIISCFMLAISIYETLYNDENSVIITNFFVYLYLLAPMLPYYYTYFEILFLGIVLALFSSTICRYWGKGFLLRLSTPLFTLIWGKTWMLSYIPISELNLTYFMTVIICFVIIFIYTMQESIPKYIIPELIFILLSAFGYLTIAIICFILALFICHLLYNLLKNHIIVTWILEWIKEVTFRGVVWSAFFVILLIGLFRGYLHTRNKPNPIAWNLYKDLCLPDGGWSPDINEATFQLNCLHLIERPVDMKGVIQSVVMTGRESVFEYYLERIPLPYFSDGLKCLFGTDAIKNCPDQFQAHNLCTQSSCFIDLGHKLSFSITLQLSDGFIVEVYCTDSLIETIMQLKIGSNVNVRGYLKNPGSKLTKFRLKCIGEINSIQNCTQSRALTGKQVKNYFSQVLSYFIPHDFIVYIL